MLYNELPYWNSVVKLFTNLENIQLVRKYRTRNGVLTALNNLICSCVTGQPEVSESTSGRIVILTLHMTSLVLMAAYSAFLISSLAVQHHDLPFRDFQGLLLDCSYKLGVLMNSSQFSVFNV